MTLGVGGPRESEAPGIYGHAKTFVAALLDRVGAWPVSSPVISDGDRRVQ